MNTNKWMRARDIKAVQDGLWAAAACALQGRGRGSLGVAQSCMARFRSGGQQCGSRYGNAVWKDSQWRRNLEPVNREADSFLRLAESIWTKRTSEECKMAGDTEGQQCLPNKKRRTWTGRGERRPAGTSASNDGQQISERLCLLY